MLLHLKNGLTFAGVIGIPLLYLVNLLVIANSQNTFSVSLPMRVIGLLVAAVGVLLWIVSMFTLGKSFGVLPHNHKRVTRGVYKYLKHPMYVGIWLTFTGLSLAGQSWGGLVFTTIFMTPILLIRSYFEEKALV